MGIISSASGSSCWRGLDYYKNKKINVYLNLEKPRKSTCNCPLANGKNNM